MMSTTGQLNMSNKQQAKQRFKVIIAGDGGVGKTMYRKRLSSEKFDMKYVPTMGVDIQPINYNDVIFNLWDCAGQEKMGSLQTDHYKGASAYIVCFDTSSMISYKNTFTFKKNIKKVDKDALIVICGMKCDIPRERRYSFDTFRYDFLLSSKTSTIDDLFKPLEYIMDKLGDGSK